MEISKLSRKELLEDKLKKFDCYNRTYKRDKALKAHYFLIKIYKQEADREQKNYLSQLKLDHAKKCLKGLQNLGEKAIDDKVFKDDIVLGRYLLSKASLMLGDIGGAKIACNSAEMYLRDWEAQTYKERKYDNEHKSDAVNPKREELKNLLKWYEKLERLEEDLEIYGSHHPKSKIIE